MYTRTHTHTHTHIHTHTHTCRCVRTSEFVRALFCVCVRFYVRAKGSTKWSQTVPHQTAKIILPQHRARPNL